MGKADGQECRCSLETSLSRVRQLIVNINRLVKNLNQILQIRIEHFLGLAKINNFWKVILGVPHDVPRVYIIVHPSSLVQLFERVFELAFGLVGQFRDVANGHQAPHHEDHGLDAGAFDLLLTLFATALRNQSIPMVLEFIGNVNIGGLPTNKVLFGFVNPIQVVLEIGPRFQKLGS